jgi:hypothetical protein
MDLRELIKIIVEVVDHYLAVSRLKVLAVSFDEENGGSGREEVLKAAWTINGEAVFSGADACNSAVDGGAVDVLFVDYIPFSVAAEIALGLAVSPFGILAHRVLARGKPVFVLKKAPGSDTLRGAYRELYKNYWRAIASFGVVLLPREKAEDTGVKAARNGAAVYEKNVLSRSDIFKYANAEKLIVGKDVVITDLARDTAKKMNIKIERRQRYADGNC